jgi:putative oxidoreductase
MKCKCNCKSIGRILVGAVLFIFGMMKVMSFSGTVGYIAAMGVPLPTVAAVIAIIIEVGAGLALIMNKYRQYVPAVAAAYLVIVTLIFHRNIGDQMQLSLALKNIAIIGGLMTLCKCSMCAGACKDGSAAMSGGCCKDGAMGASEGCCKDGKDGQEAGACCKH